MVRRGEWEGGAVFVFFVRWVGGEGIYSFIGRSVFGLMEFFDEDESEVMFLVSDKSVRVGLELGSRFYGEAF